jgi:hypothetical protein
MSSRFRAVAETTKGLRWTPSRTSVTSRSRPRTTLTVRVAVQALVSLPVPVAAHMEFSVAKGKTVVKNCVCVVLLGKHGL